MTASLLAVLAAYLLGSIPFALVFSKVFGLADPRTYGSKNPGATNVLRSGSKPAAILTLVFDALKGWLPVWLAQSQAARFGLSDATIALVALAAFLGHCYSVFLGFKGGKGVATAVGVLFGLHVELALLTILTFAILMTFLRMVSLASIVGALFAVFWTVMRWGTDATALAVLVMSAVLIWRHRANIDRILKGTESRWGAKKR